VTSAPLTAIQPAEADSDPRSGFRLARLELYNWGTFHKRVWSFEPGGHDCLLTGDAGSGKSTMVDAITTLLLPAHRITYNKAAGAEARERSLRSYVLGYYKGERSDTTGASRPVPLRDETAFSVILGVFTNAGYNSVVTLAQVFWLREGHQGQPERFFVIADRELSVAADFSDFGTEITPLKKRLRTAGVRVHDSFPEYGRDFRRRLGIESEQALELFHQAVSMKSVGNLTGFVREHMLEPFDAAAWTAKIVAHFEDLTNAHDAVRRAQAQILALGPLLADCDACDRITADIDAATAQRSASRFFFAEAKAGLLEGQIQNLDTERAGLLATLKQLDDRLAELRDKDTSLNLQRAGHGGNRIAELERMISAAETTCDQRMANAERFGKLLAQVDLEAVETAERFAVCRRQVAAARSGLEQAQADFQNRLMELGGDKKKLGEQAGEVNAELRSLRSRKSNIPLVNLGIRDLLCAELGLAGSALPFAGELIAVRAAESDWEGAAERLLHGFALSVLVPDEHYAAASEWVNANHLAGRFVYYRVLAGSASPAGDSRSAGGLLYGKLEIKDTEFTPWLERELASRAAYECVEGMADFRRLPRAITKAGQIKGAGGRHEKDDRRRVDDRSGYVLGWTNERKVSALLRRAAAIQDKLNVLAAAEKTLKDEAKQASERAQILAALGQTTDFTEIDWQPQVNQIEELKAEKRDLEHASAELQRLNAELEAVKAQITSAETEKRKVTEGIGGLEHTIESAGSALEAARRVLAEPECEAGRPVFTQIAALMQAPPLVRLEMNEPADCDGAAVAVRDELTARIDGLRKRQVTLSNRAVAKMGEFRRQYHVETSELDDSLASAAGYRELYARLVEDDLPRFQHQFKRYLNQNTIRDIAGFQSQLNKQAELIRDRVEVINESLVDVDYNPGRFIRLEAQPTQDTDIRDFRTDLRACTDDAVSCDATDQYSEQKFLQVSRIIERFRGREGQTESDRTWTRRVTDVRNWFIFSASERWREDNTEHEHYADSGGKSGGQKEKLAYTILAASLAYQFKLERGTGRSKTFRLAVIDEAFGRGPDKSAQFGLELFRRLGLQLLVVTPLQKIHVIEPYVSVVGFVDNPNERDSRLYTLTVEEYRARRRAHEKVTVLGEQPARSTAGS
jgi:uncharacterized protein YPO0396